jgi:hypothetical protein
MLQDIERRCQFDRTTACSTQLSKAKRRIHYAAHVVSLGAWDRISPCVFCGEYGCRDSRVRKSALIQVRSISYRFLEKRAPFWLRLLRHRGGTFDPTGLAHAFHQWGSLALIRVFRCFGPYFWRQDVRNDLLCRIRNC